MAESVWDYPRPPRLESVARRLRVEHQDLLIADAPRGWRVLETSHPPTYYLAREFIRMDALLASRHRTVCEFKGTATYWDLARAGTRVANIAWCYEAPTDPYRELTGAIAFYASRLDRCLLDDEVVRPEAGTFYGGWVSSDIAV